MSNLVTVSDFLKRASQQIGFEREKYIESDVPENFSDVVVFIFYGDYRAEIIYSSLLLHQYIKKNYKDKYIILCSWQGHASLFPYVNEFWSISDQMSLNSLNNKAIKFINKSDIYSSTIRNLHKYFEQVVEWNDMEKYYNDGLTNLFFDDFDDNIKVLYPYIPSPKIDFVRSLSQKSAKAVMIYPKRKMRKFDVEERDTTIKEEFWKKLCDGLIERNITPVVYQNYLTYDLSRCFGDKCVYCTDNNVGVLMSSMRATGCVLDVFSGISRLSLMARCPFICVDERKRYLSCKEFEINDLFINNNFPYRYILSFCSVLEHNNYKEIIQQVLNITEMFIKNLGKSKIPSSSESYQTVNYDVVRKHKEKKLGIRFVKVERFII